MEDPLRKRTPPNYTEKQNDNKTVGFFGGPLKIKVAKQLVKQEAQEMFPNEEAENNDAENYDSVSSPNLVIWASFVKKKSLSEQYHKPSYSQIDQELKEFLNTKTIDFDADAIDWWVKIGKGSFPMLYEVAMKYLIIPGSSVPSERVFSTLGNTLSKKRTKMSREMVDKMVMLNKNGQGLF